jgi:hypothetical protein
MTRHLARIGLGALAVLAFLTSSAALGATQRPVVAVDPASATPGQKVTVRGSGFCGTAACGRVSVEIYGLIAADDIRVSPRGTFTARVRVPGGPPTGEVGLTAMQRAADGSELRAITVIELVVRAKAKSKAAVKPAARPAKKRKTSVPPTAPRSHPVRPEGPVPEPGRRSPHGAGGTSKAGEVPARSRPTAVPATTGGSGDGFPAGWVIGAALAVGAALALLLASAARRRRGRTPAASR